MGKTEEIYLDRYVNGTFHHLHVLWARCSKSNDPTNRETSLLLQKVLPQT